MAKVCIIDYGSGNVKSVYNLISFLGYNVCISNDADVIKGSSHLILPGVGSFKSAMQKIHNNVPLKVLKKEVIEHKKPFLGICVGMQILAEVGFEYGEHRGLGWIDGTVGRLDLKQNPLPHIGWNNILIKKQSKIVNNLEHINDFYFVHSYVFRTNESFQIADTEYEIKFPSIIQKDNIYGVQFHPEKSQRAGQMLFKNFINI